jgi:hypothetical protein
MGDVELKALVQLPGPLVKAGFEAHFPEYDTGEWGLFELVQDTPGFPKGRPQKPKGLGPFFLSPLSLPNPRLERTMGFDHT